MWTTLGCLRESSQIQSPSTSQVEAEGRPSRKSGNAAARGRPLVKCARSSPMERQLTIRSKRTSTRRALTSSKRRSESKKSLSLLTTKAGTTTLRQASTSTSTWTFVRNEPRTPSRKSSVYRTKPPRFSKTLAMRFKSKLRQRSQANTTLSSKTVTE